VAPAFTFSGTVGTNYATSSKIITGYTLTETPANATGNFTEANTIVRYVYSNNTVVINEEEVPEGGSPIIDFDSYSDEPTIEGTTSEATTDDEVIIETEETPLADALPQTGQLPVELFYGFGGLIAAAGVFLKKKN